MSSSTSGSGDLLSFEPSEIDESAYYDDLIMDSANRCSLTIEDGTNPPGLGNIKTMVLAYNPEQLSISRSVSWTSVETDGNNSQQAYAGGGEDTIDLPVLLDGSEWKEEGGGSVLQHIEYLHALSAPYDIDGKGKANMIRPPIVSLKMGDLLFVGVVTAIKTTIEMFTATGNPMRAVVSLSLKGAFLPADADAGKDLILAAKAKADKGKAGSTESDDDDKFES
jgi:hypothetical protein